MHDKFLGGVSMSLLMMIHETAKKQSVNVPLDLLFCGISMKDELQDTPIIKVLGILNSDWKKSWGGGFEHGGVLLSPEPGDFIVFDPRVPHKAQDIFTDKKRIAIDWTIRK